MPAPLVGQTIPGAQMPSWGGSSPGERELDQEDELAPLSSRDHCAPGVGLAGALSLLITMHAFAARPPPLVADDDGVVRITGTRLQLETLVLAFDAGATAEEIAQQYTSVELADVYAVISYVLTNEAAVRDYVAKRVNSAQALRTVIEGSMPSDGIRQRLLARRHSG